MARKWLLLVIGYISGLQESIIFFDEYGIWAQRHPTVHSNAFMTAGEMLDLTDRRASKRRFQRSPRRIHQVNPSAPMLPINA
jgi:SpoVK/Ycf46/Vps4 family AAA+-type ATPase